MALLQTVPVLCAANQSQSVSIVVNAVANFCLDSVHCTIEDDTSHLQNKMFADCTDQCRILRWHIKQRLLMIAHRIPPVLEVQIRSSCSNTNFAVHICHMEELGGRKAAS